MREPIYSAVQQNYAPKRRRVSLFLPRKACWIDMDAFQNLLKTPRYASPKQNGDRVPGLGWRREKSGEVQLWVGGLLWSIFVSYLHLRQGRRLALPHTYAAAITLPGSRPPLPPTHHT